MSTGKQYLPLRCKSRQTLVVGIGHLHEVPLAVAVVFCRLCRHEVRGVAACRHYLAVHTEHRVALAGDVQVGQPLHLHLDHRKWLLGGSRE
jgi:hypothetical protein